MSKNNSVENNEASAKSEVKEKLDKNQMPAKDKNESVVIKASVQDIKDGILAANKVEKELNWEKIIKGIGLFLLTTIVGVIITITCTYIYELAFKAELDVKSVQVEIVGDGTVINGADVEKNGYASSVGKELTINEDDVVDGVYDFSEHWSFFAPKITMEIQYKGTIKSIYIYYLDKDNEDFLVQKVSTPKKNDINAIEAKAICDFMLNFTIRADSNSERIYIMIEDKNDDYKLYCARIDKYDQSSVSSNPVTIEVKSSDEIYETVSNEKNDYWCLQKNQIVKEMTEIMTNRHNTK